MPTPLLLLSCVSSLLAPSAGGGPELRSIGELAFGPDCIFVSDPMGGAIYAFEKPPTEVASTEPFLIADADVQIAALLGTTAENVRVVDLDVDPASHTIYLSVMRGLGYDSMPVLIRVVAGEFEEVALEDLAFTRKALSNLPEDQQDARSNPRLDTVTDMAFVDGRLIVAGLSNEEFASRLRSYAYPFLDGDAVGEETAVEIYHGNHGAYETRSPVRTFLPYEVEGEQQLVAAYTCTPLVMFPVDELTPGAKVRGKTVAELGGGNRPLDMIAYERDGEPYLLISNNRRGLMKLSARDLAPAKSITAQVTGPSGIDYETIEDLEGIEHMAALDERQAVAWIADKVSGGRLLATIEMP